MPIKALSRRVNMKHITLLAFLILVAVVVAGCGRDDTSPSSEGGVHSDGHQDTIPLDAGRDVPEGSCSASDILPNDIACYETTPPCFIPMGRPECVQQCYYGRCYRCVDGRWVMAVIDCVAPVEHDSAPVDTAHVEASAE